MIKDYIVGIGLDVLKDKVQEGISQNEIKHKLREIFKVGLTLLEAHTSCFRIIAMLAFMLRSF